MQLNQYAWLDEPKAKIGANLPPAMLMHGLNGVGKRTLALHLAQSALCEKVSLLQTPCETCPSCHLFQAETHPDFKILSNDESDASADDVRASTNKKTKQVIGVKTVRELGTFCYTKPHRGHAKIIIIDPADNLNQNASNALLKNLEEPPEFLHFILLAKHSELLIPTILSRCLKVHVKSPELKVTSSWIEQQSSHDHIDEHKKELAIRLSGCAPFASTKLIEDVDFFEHRDKILSLLSQTPINAFSLAALCEKIETPVIQRIFYPLLHDLLMIGLGGDMVFHKDKVAEIRRIKRSLTPKKITHWQDNFNDYLKSANHPLNRRLALEALFLKWPQT